MRSWKIVPLLAAVLVMGVVVGQVASGFAAPSKAGTNTVAAACGQGLRLGGTMAAAGGRLVDVVAKLTGLSAEEVQAKRAEGASFGAIADDAGVEAAAVVDGALEVRKQALADKVAAGAITQQQADEVLARMETRLTERVDSTTPCTGGGGGGCGTGDGFGGGRSGRGGRAGGACGSGACGQVPAAQ